MLGTFAMYYAEPRAPEAADLELIEAAGQIALVAIQLEQSQAALRESEGRFRLVVNTIPVMPRFHSDGAFAGYIGSGFDVTERKLAEEALSMVSRRLIEAQEQERTRLARELH